MNRAAVLSVLATALPPRLASELASDPAQFSSDVVSAFSASGVPAWFTGLPTPIQNYLIGAGGNGNQASSSSSFGPVSRTISPPSTYTVYSSSFPPYSSSSLAPSTTTPHTLKPHILTPHTLTPHTPISTASPTPTHSSSGGPKIAGIVGGVIGAVAGIALVVLVIVGSVYERRKREKREQNEAILSAPPETSYRIR